MSQHNPYHGHRSSLKGHQLESLSLAIMDFSSPYYSVDWPSRYQSETIFTIAQRDHGTIFMGVCNEHVSQMMSKDIISLSFETGSQFPVPSATLPSQSINRCQNSEHFAFMTIINQQSHPFSLFQRNQGTKSSEVPNLNMKLLWPDCPTNCPVVQHEVGGFDHNLSPQLSFPRIAPMLNAQVPSCNQLLG